MQIKVIFSTIIAFFVTFSIYANEVIRQHVQLKWSEKLKYENINGESKEQYYFEGAIYPQTTSLLPYFLWTQEMSYSADFKVNITNEKYEIIQSEAAFTNGLDYGITIKNSVTQSRQNWLYKTWFLPMKKISETEVAKLISFDLVIEFLNKKELVQNRGPENTFTSVLSSGDVYKFSISQTGMCKLDYNFLKNELKLNVDQIDPRKIHLYGNGGFDLPALNSTPRIDDLSENAIFIKGEEDGKFDKEDYILFYGLGVNEWIQDGIGGFTMRKNIYEDESYYFIKAETANGLRLGKIENGTSSDYTSDSYNAYNRFEDDKVNLLARGKPNTQGSGKQWFGDYFYTTREKNYSNFNFPNIVANDSTFVRSEFSARSSSSSYFQIVINGKTLNSTSMHGVSISDLESSYASTGYIEGWVNLNSSSPSVSFRYPQTTSSSEGWLDYIEMNTRCQLKQLSGKPLYFRDLRTLKYDNSTFKIELINSSILVWDITNPYIAAQQEGINDNASFTFNFTSRKLKEYVIFTLNDAFISPKAVGKIENQNLHGYDNLDMLIITAPEFINAGEQMANHRRNHSKLSVLMTTTEKIYNEFSSGGMNPTAIRDLCKMLYERNPQKFKYVLLLGDGSFDYKALMNTTGNTNFVPAYETNESFEPIESYPTDDYYALLSPQEGLEVNKSFKGALDISVGRLPVKTLTEAQDLVSKIIRYETNSASQGEWRIRATFMADDGDNNVHLNQTEGIANLLAQRYPVFNQEKIYFDATPRIISSGGARFPNATTDLNNDMNKGNLVFCYLGHGGPKSLSQERVLTSTEINSWTNIDKLPLFITATCSFSGYDDPTQTTAGEQIILKENGGAAAMFSTVRAVYSSQNERLTRAVFDNVMTKQADGKGMRVGDIMRIAKNSNSSDTSESNARKFTLLGDPAMQFSIPQYDVVTTKIRGKAYNEASLDTFKAFQKIQIEGNVVFNGNLIPSFNGKVFVSIYDKPNSVSTLGQGTGNYSTQFSLQRVILFKGVASVTNGQFKITVVIPKDINYQYGIGKISYYAVENKGTDAAGYSSVVVGGSEIQPEPDKLGPDIAIYFNDENFVFGNTIDQTPLLLVKLKDKSGINVSTASIGHDLQGVIDDNNQNTLILNEYYQTEADNYQQGEIRFPLSKLSEGRHKLRIKAWDTVNNSNEQETEFIVSSDASLALSQVLNYPNPFTTKTSFQFEHRYSGQLLDIQVQIFTISGILVKTLDSRQASEGNLVKGIEWDGKDDFGQSLAKGVYVYKIRAKPTNSSKNETANSDYRKLVILK